jgi:hypothetical protein
MMNVNLPAFNPPPGGLPPTGFTQERLCQLWKSASWSIHALSKVATLHGSEYESLDDGAKAYLAYQMTYVMSQCQ